MSSTTTTPTSSYRPRRPTRSPPAIPTHSLDQSSSQISQEQDASVFTTTASCSSPTAISPPDPPTDLTPLRAHYLKKALIQQCIEHELDLLTSNNATLSFLGPPFSPPPKDAPPMDLPFIRYLFRQFVLTFPFMAAAPNDFYSAKLQPFFASVLSRNLSPTSIFDDESGDAALRRKVLAKLQRNLSLFIGSATKLKEKEEVVRLNQADLDRLEKLAEKRNKRMSKHKEGFDVNIVSVRTVVDRGREFIIRTRHARFPDIYVARRHGDFRTLADQLRKMHPNELIPNPPAKDRTVVQATAPAQSPVSPAFSPRQQQTLFSDTSSLSSTESINSVAPMPTTRHSLSREKNRLTLRAYLHSIFAASSELASSPVLESFLTSNPIRLTPVEVEDSKRREEADNIREEGRKKFAKEIAARVDGLRFAIQDLKVDVMNKDGLSRIFGVVKVTEDIHDLPPEYQAVLEWARVSLASTVFHNFVAADNSSELFASLKRIHGLMPYFMLKTALKISNPISMIRNILDLFMAQPFGGRSLLQRMFTSSLAEEVKALEEDIDAVMQKVDDPMICEKIRRFVYAPREIQDLLRADSATEKQNLLTVVLRSGDEPLLSHPQMQRVARAHRAHAAYMQQRNDMVDSDDDDGPPDEDAWLYEDLKVLANLYSRLRDREMIIAIIFEGFTADLLKDIITIFYAPLAQVYKAASIADSLGDLQNFINDLIKTVEQVDDSDQQDPSRTVQTFIDLIQRHEQSFYNFVHRVHSKGDGLFDSLMHWIELFVTTVREGLQGPPLSIEVVLPHPGTQERKDLLDEVDKVAKYHYRLKVLYEDKLRRRFGRSDNGTDATAEDEHTQRLVEGVVGDIGFGDLVKGEANDMAAEDSDDDSDEYDSSDEDSDGEESTSSGSTEEDTSSEAGSESIPDTTPKQTFQSPSKRPSAALPQQPVQTPDRRRHHELTPRQSPAQPASASNTPKPRQRSLSLRSKRSLNFLKPSLSKNEPVPPLPTKPSSAGFNKPLPPSPGRYSLDRPPRSSTSSAPPAQSLPSPKHPAKQKKGPPTLQPPDLKHIPTIRPIFVEMMRPYLRTRRNTEILNIQRYTLPPDLSNMTDSKT